MNPNFLSALVAKILGNAKISAPNAWRPRAFVFADRAPSQTELRRRRGLELHETLPLYQLLRRRRQSIVKRLPPCPERAPLPQTSKARDADWEETMLAVAKRTPPLPTCEEAARHSFPPGPRYCRRSLDTALPLIFTNGRCLSCGNEKEAPCDTTRLPSCSATSAST